MSNKKTKLLSCFLAMSVVAASPMAFAQSSMLGSSARADRETEKTPASNEAEDKEQKTQQGRDIFSAVHFMVGEKAEELTLIKEINKAPDFNKEANTQFAVETMDALQQEDPDYFSKYAEEMTGGNPVAVEHAISQGQDNINQYVKKNYPKSAAQGEMTPQACSIGVGGCVWTVALAWNYGVAVNIGGVVAVYTALWGPGKTWSPFAEQDSNLQRQTMIAALTQQLEAE